MNFVMFSIASVPFRSIFPIVGSLLQAGNGCAVNGVRAAVNRPLQRVTNTTPALSGSWLRELREQPDHMVFRSKKKTPHGVNRAESMTYLVRPEELESPTF